jgi:hypothetical protein
MKLKLFVISAALMCVAQVSAQDTAPQGGSPVTVEPTGTLRTKFEYQPAEGNARFSVRTARFGVGGKVYSLDYNMEIDLSDEGKIKMVDAYIGGKIYKGLSFNIGYMRVPFTIDAHRSPHLQLFANRSFIAKQVGNVRDVGASLGWKFNAGEVPLNIQAGMFNGSGLPDDLQSYWTRSFNYSTKVQAQLPETGLGKLNLVAGWQTTKPAQVRIHMVDAGVTWTAGRWMAEGEYLRKEYGAVFDGVNSVNTMVSYGIPLTHRSLKRLSLLGRWDYMGDHSNGVTPLPIPLDYWSTSDTTGSPVRLAVTDPARHRATLGATLGLGLPFTAEIRLNFEKYFYSHNNLIPVGPSDHDKIVLEFMAHF